MTVKHTNMTSETTILLFCGIPASGKSYYGHWMKQTKGFLHFDLEHGALNGTDLKPLWDALFSSDTDVAAESFVRALTQLAHPVVLDWGFPICCLPIVQSLKRTGVEVWWFDGNRDIARQDFISRGTGTIERFDSQMADIRREWQAIERSVGTHIMNTVKVGSDHYVEPESVFPKLYEQQRQKD